MNLKTKRLIDFYCGTFALAIFYVAAKALGALLRRSHQVEPCHTVLVAKFQGLGSLMIAAHAVAQLRKLRPGIKVIFWGTPSTTTLARELNCFDEVLELNDRNLIS